MNEKERNKFCKTIEPFLMNLDYLKLTNMVTELDHKNTELRRKIKELKKNQSQVRKILIKLKDNAVQDYYEDLTLKLEQCIKKIQ